eukprot:6183362-Pleurochrysis_carterae.AAC.1
MEVDDAPSPCRPRNLATQWEEDRKGPDLMVRTRKDPSPETNKIIEPIEEGSEGVPALPVSFVTDSTDVPTEPPFHELQLKEQARD